MWNENDERGKKNIKVERMNDRRSQKGCVRERGSDGETRQESNNFQ